MINEIKTEMESRLAEMGASVEVTFISSKEFSIATEDEKSFKLAKSILAMANQKLTGEEHDIECGFFGYYAF